jgi:uncharacterized protein involved in exopolysaccharide biosynthesis
MIQQHRDEISVSEFMGYLLRARWLILTVTIVFTVACATASFLLTKKHEASTVLSPVSSSTNGGGLSGGLSSLASQFGDIASMAGISTSTDTKKAESLATLQSEALTTQYIQRENLLPVLFNDKWDAQKNRWKVSDPEKMPTLWKGNQFFKKTVRSITNDTKSGLVTLTITWKDPRLAAKWANDLVKLTNDDLRNKAIRQSESDIAFLNDQAAKTPEVGVKQGIYTLLQNEIKQAMLARATEEFALKVIDPAVAPEKAVFPDKIAWTLSGFVGGLLLSVLFVLVRSK